MYSCHRAYAILDELIIAGELQESSKKATLRGIGQADSIEECVYPRPAQHVLTTDCTGKRQAKRGWARDWQADDALQPYFSPRPRLLGRPLRPLR